MPSTKPHRQIGKGKTVTVIGGGISGLYCARELAERGYSVEVLEATRRLGGRVETVELSPGPFIDSAGFKAEMGPMRFELDIQPLMKGLLVEYDIECEDFTPPTPAEPPIDYRLEASYRSNKSGLQLSSLELLKLGVFRLFPDELEPEIEEARDTKGRLRAVVALRRGGEWIDSLGDDGSFDTLRQKAVMPGTSSPLRDFGFWNALYKVLGPRAVAKILHFGTFYHLMPDNPNAAEWAIFWLRLFRPTGSQLSTVKAGTETVAGELRAKVEGLGVNVRSSNEVTALRPAADRQRVEIEVRGEKRVADRVILALPKESLQRLADGFSRQTRKDLDAVIAFPLLKVFCVTKTPPWWTEPQEPQQGAWLAPTREVHYFPREQLGKSTLILFYTDRPATTFWQSYLSMPEGHDQAEKGGNTELRNALVTILFESHWITAYERVSRVAEHPLIQLVSDPVGRQILEALAEFRANAVVKAETDSTLPILAQKTPALVKNVARVIFDPEGVWRWQKKAIGDYAIRDWSQRPYGAGCHAWRPGARSWEVRERLAGFGFGADGAENLHVCGEAYSDYQGFIEGALRSAVDACNSILLGDGGGEADLISRDG